MPPLLSQMNVTSLFRYGPPLSAGAIPWALLTVPSPATPTPQRKADFGLRLPGPFHSRRRRRLPLSSGSLRPSLEGPASLRGVLVLIDAYRYSVVAGTIAGEGSACQAKERIVTDASLMGRCSPCLMVFKRALVPGRMWVRRSCAWAAPALSPQHERLSSHPPTRRTFSGIWGTPLPTSRQAQTPVRGGSPLLLRRTGLHSPKTLSAGLRQRAHVVSQPLFDGVGRRLLDDVYDRAADDGRVGQAAERSQVLRP